MDAMVASIPPDDGLGTTAVAPPGREQAGDVAVARAPGVPGAGARELRPELFGVRPVVHGVSMTPLRRHRKHHRAVTTTSPGAPSRLAAVPRIAPLQVQVIARTSFDPPDDVPWETDVDGGQALAEFAGRACYESWDKPTPATATNQGFLRHILEVGHGSVLEHASVSMYLTGVSRSLTHELVRHRHFSFSQLSQRHVPDSDVAVVEPAVVADDPDLHATFLAATEAALAAYRRLLDALESGVADAPNAALRRRQARQAARSLLPA